MLTFRIIGFLANLAHFQHDTINDQYVATRLTDGTIFLPSKDPEDNERGLLLVYWQGDSNRKSVVIGTQIALLEIVEAIKHWVATGEMENEQESIRHMFEHFRFKTGESLYIAENDRLLPKSLEPIIKDLGWAAFKKMFGL